MSVSFLFTIPKIKAENWRNHQCLSRKTLLAQVGKPVLLQNLFPKKAFPVFILSPELSSIF